MGHPSDLDRLDAAGARDVLTGALTEMMRRSAQTRMTVLWFDNLQWADPMLRDLLAVIVRSLADLPFLLITGQRPDDDIVWPPPVERPLVLRVPLGPLGRDDATTLVRGVLERDQEATEQPWFDDDVASVLVDRGGGNPLFLVELAALAATCGPRSELPGSLRALIAARLDQLPAPQRAIVDNAAVLGSADSIGGLVRFAQAMGQEFRDSDLAELAADGLFDVDGRRWRFRSDVVREVAYQTLTKRIRAQRHAGVAAVLAGEHKDQVDDLAHHSAAAAELIAELGPVDGVPSSIAVEGDQRPAQGRFGRRRRGALLPCRAPRQPRPRSASGRSRDRAPAAARAGQRGDGRAPVPGGDRRRPAGARRGARRRRPGPRGRGPAAPGHDLADAGRARGRPAGARLRRRPVPGAGRARAAGRRAAGAWLRRGLRRLAHGCETVPRRGDGDLPRDRRRARPRVDPSEPRLGGLPVGRLRRRRDAAARSRGALRGDRRPQRRELGAGPARLRVVLPPSVRRCRDAWRSPSRARPGGGASRGRH